MITLITGTPGSGKTAHAVDMLLDIYKGRPVFADGIPDLAIDHQPCPAVPDWTHEVDDPASASGKKISFTFPPNSIVVVDECQRVFRPRAASAKVPPEVAAFETHRHLGIDFFLITQHPSLVDSNIRRLVGRHIHIKVTALGRYRYEWAEAGDPDSQGSRDRAARSKYTLPKRAFEKYKSAELHTKTKIKIPHSVYIFAGALTLLVGVSAYIYQTITAKLGPEDAPPSANAARITAPTLGGMPSGTARPAAANPDREPMTAKEYVEHYTPRLTGLQHTAPAYDNITQPVEAPIPVGCIKRPKTGECKCYNQQGTVYQTTTQVCEAVMDGGLYFAWKPSAPPPPVAPSAPPVAPEAASGPRMAVIDAPSPSPSLSASPTSSRPI